MVRALCPLEPLRPGDVIVESGRAFFSRAIQWAAGDDINHTAIVTESAPAGASHVQVVEAVAAGVIEHTRPMITAGYVLRISDDEKVAASTAVAAQRLAARGIRYSWATIVWHAMATIRRKRILIPLRPIAYLVQPLAARHAARDSHMICSEATTVALLDSIVGDDPDVCRVARQLSARPAWQVAPVDVYRTLAMKWGHMPEVVDGCVVSRSNALLP